jgi:hypothetical protein
VSTELSSGTISNILETVPGIATVLRSPVADAIVNLSRAAAGLIPFDKKDAHELIRYAVRRGLIRSEEGDRVAAEIDGVPLPKPVAPKPAAPTPVVAPKARPRPVAKKPAPRKPAARKPAAKRPTRAAARAKVVKKK